MVVPHRSGGLPTAYRPGLFLPNAPQASLHMLLQAVTLPWSDHFPFPSIATALRMGGGGELAGGGDSRKKSVALRASRAEACTVRGLPSLITRSRTSSK